MEVKTNLNLDNLSKKTDRAHKLLNMQIVADCDLYVPFRQGALRGSVRYPEGINGDKIMYDTPYAHYMYVGKVYGPNIPRYDEQGNLIGFYSPKGKKKNPTGRALTYHTAGTGAQWFEKAKAEHKDEWVELVKEEMLKD